ncbi:acyl-CoA dehydrogenase family protein [Streptomyces hoynatensis]|uniref:Acyl-CoA dehydrogenase n=1 Tax=Streptomyces hoynatensis TaxID=1141874 RepID=A0A3A9YNT0_9ACTN|nr:acyl-CoA dehydrogenase family protein [Streptomyces hoynatensis]RKN36706.1 acyl-CoA dehydrogenase [Streptomyces hoynatensis]
MTAAKAGTATVLGAVQDLLPTLRENGKAAEAQRSVPQENIDLLENAGVFRMTVPRRFGGLGLPVADQYRVLTEVARGCGSTGWVAQIWSAAAWVVTLFPERAQEEVFATGTVRVSAGLTPTGTLTPTDGGFLLNGSWKWVSGCQGADWCNLAALPENPDGAPVPSTALVPRSEVSVIDDWDTTAAAGTGSATVVAKNVFVPTHRVALMPDLLGAGSPGRGNTGATGGNYAMVPYFMVVGAASYLGMAKGAYELFLDRLPGRGITYTSWTDQSQSPLTHLQVATAAGRIAAAEALSAGWFRVLQDRADAGEQPTVAERAQIRGQVGFSIMLLREAVEELHTASGASVIHRDVPFQRFYRDITGLSLHGLFLPTTNLELQGRVAVGLPPDTPFL